MLNKLTVGVALGSTLFFTACTDGDFLQTSKPNVSLTNTYWKAMIFYDRKVPVVTKEAHIKFDKDLRINGMLGCNNFFGSYIEENKNLSFSQIGSTRMMCQNITTENTFSKVLQETKTYKIDGETLHFYDKNAKEISRFKAIYF